MNPYPTASEELRNFNYNLSKAWQGENALGHLKAMLWFTEKGLDRHYKNNNSVAFCTIF